jgi:hypothetical protein
MMVDRGPKILQFASGGGVGRPLNDISAAQIAIDVAKHLIAKELQ